MEFPSVAHSDGEMLPLGPAAQVHCFRARVSSLGLQIKVVCDADIWGVASPVGSCHGGGVNSNLRAFDC